MDKEREDRILEAIGRREKELIDYMDKRFENIDKRV